jgi:hypothetical protein
MSCLGSFPCSTSQVCYAIGWPRGLQDADDVTNGEAGRKSNDGIIYRWESHAEYEPDTYHGRQRDQDSGMMHHCRTYLLGIRDCHIDLSKNGASTWKL